MDFLYFAGSVFLLIYFACAVVGAVKFLRDLHKFHPYKSQVDKMVKAHAYLKDIVAHEDYMLDDSAKEELPDEVH